MPTTLYFIRHGQTDHNLEKRMQGHLDIPLNAEGRKQAQQVAEFLSTIPLDAIFTSDLQRASQTAGEIARRQGLTPRQDKDLRERCFGGFENLIATEIMAQYPDAYAEWKSFAPHFQFPAPHHNPHYFGESMRQFYERTTQAVLFHANNWAGKHIAFVTHGGVLDCIYRYATGQALNTPRTCSFHNASVQHCELSEDKTMRIRQWGLNSPTQPPKEARMDSAYPFAHETIITP